MQQGNDSFRLVVRRGPQPNQVYELNKDVVTLGRDITNDIVINDPEVSRHHLRFTRGADGYTIEDLGSTNGTFINGQRVSAPRPLNNGDMLGLGETVTLGYERARPVSFAPESPGAAPVQPPQYGQPAPQPPAYGQQPPAQPPQYGQPPQQPAYGQQPPAQPQYGQPAPQSPAQPQYGQPAQPAPYAPQGQQPGQPGQYGQQPQPPQQAGQYSYGQQPAAGQPGYDPQQAAYGAAGYGSPQPPAAGYDYDPYAAREEQPRNTLRWVAIGCLVVGLVCVCASLIALVVIDTLNLWNTFPFLRDLLLPFANLIF